MKNVTTVNPFVRKGEETRSQILAVAVEQASACGFESLTIGSLAEKTGMSKSGLFAHFGSKIELQIAALDEAARQFTEQVFMPALKAPPFSSYPSQVRGLVYVTGCATLNGQGRIEGVLACEGSITGQGTLSLVFDPSFASSPPPGFGEAPTLVPQAGTAARVVR